MRHTNRYIIDSLRPRFAKFRYSKTCHSLLIVSHDGRAPELLHTYRPLSSALDLGLESLDRRQDFRAIMARLCLLCARLSRSTPSQDILKCCIKVSIFLFAQITEHLLNLEVINRQDSVVLLLRLLM